MGLGFHVSALSYLDSGIERLQLQTSKAMCLGDGNFTAHVVVNKRER